MLTKVAWKQLLILDPALNKLRTLNAALHKKDSSWQTLIKLPQVRLTYADVC